MCHYLGIFSDIRSIHACMMYLLHIILSEYQQVLQYANGDAGLSFVDSISITPHPAIHDPPSPPRCFMLPVAYMYFPSPQSFIFYASAAYCPSPKKSKSPCQLVCVYAYVRAGTCFWIIDDNHYVSKYI